MIAYLNEEEITDSKFDTLTRSYIKNKQSFGVFETMRIDNTHGVYLKERHLARLIRGIKSIQAEFKNFSNLDLSLIADYFESDSLFFQTRLRDKKLKAAVLRYQIILDEKNPNTIIRMFKARSVISPDLNKLKIKICRTVLPENVFTQGRKDIDRRVYDKANKELDKRFYDGILCNAQGHVVEGIKTNIFAIKDNNLYTPSLSLGGVAGIMRQVFIERVQEAGLNVILAPLHFLELMQMDAVFLTNSIIGVVKVDYILLPDRKRSANVFKSESAGFQNILALNVLKNNHHYKRIKS